MRRLHLLLLSSLCGCAAPLEVLVDRDEGAEFSALCNYAWVDGTPEGAEPAAVADNALLDARVRDAVFKQLEAKGLYQAAGGKPDLTVHYHAVIEENTKVLTHRNFDEQGGVTLATSEQTEVFTLNEGTLLVDIHDGSTDRLIWRGVAKDLHKAFVNGGEELDRAVDEAVTTMFQRYPKASTSCRSAQ
jgi:hypothetical protein